MITLTWPWVYHYIFLFLKTKHTISHMNLALDLFHFRTQPKQTNETIIIFGQVFDAPFVSDETAWELLFVELTDKHLQVSVGFRFDSPFD